MVTYSRVLPPAAVAVLLSVLCLGCTLPAPFLSRSIHILSYNVENLFDDHDDGTEYRDYDPGSGAWSTSLYHAKLHNISQAIAKSVRGGPDICLLQEIESSKALDDLGNEYLNALGYRYTFIAPRKDEATSVAVLSRLSITGIRVHRLHSDIPTRPILEIELDARGARLVIMNNHWKSKSGGPAETEKYRIEAAGLLKSRIRSIIADNPEIFLVALGDLNEETDEFYHAGGGYQTALLPLGAEVPAAFAAKSIFLAPMVNQAGAYDDRLVLYSPWYESEQPGSYSYKGSWEQIDHFLIYDGDGPASGISVGAFGVVEAEFLLREDSFPKRWSPLSASGYSDHLPLLLTLDRARR